MQGIVVPGLGLWASTMASILNNVTVSQAYSFFLHGGERVKTREEKDERRAWQTR